MNWITEAREAHQGAKATDAAAVLRELVEADAAYTNRGRVELRETYGAIVDRYFKAWEAARAFASGVPEAPEARRERLSKACGEALGWNKPDGVGGTDA